MNAQTLNRLGRPPFGFLLLLLLGVLVGRESIAAGSRIRDILSVAMALGLVGLALRRPRWSLTALIAYLPMMGFIRRLLIPWAGWTSHDPLVLVPPVIVGVLYIAYMLHRFHRGENWGFHDDRLTTMVQWLIVIQFLEIFNPLQGSVLAGLAGAIFDLVPLLWMVLAREYVDDTLIRKVYLFILVFGIIASLYGLRQTFYGLFPFEQQWVLLGGYMALHVGNHIRAFSTFSSSAEYAVFLSMAIIVSWGFWLRGSPLIKVLILGPMAVLGYALFMESSRSPLVLTLAGIFIMTLVSQTTRARRIFTTVAFALVIVAAYRLLGHVDGATSGALVSHQINGLLDPLNSKDSTLSAHFSMMVSGFISGIKVPFGHGLGSVSLGGSLFGTSSASTEVDFSNMFVSSGIVGGVLYLAIMVTVYRRLWSLARSGYWAGTVGLGLITCSLLSWLIGGDYSTTALVWLVVGWSARQHHVAELFTREMELSARDQV